MLHRKPLSTALVAAMQAGRRALEPTPAPQTGTWWLVPDEQFSAVHRGQLDRITKAKTQPVYRRHEDER